MTSTNLSALHDLVQFGNWSIVMSPLVVRSLKEQIARRRNVERSWERERSWFDDGRTRLIAVIPSRPGWTSLIYALGASSADQAIAAETDCVALSRLVADGALSLRGSRVTMTMEYSLYRKGRLLERLSVWQGIGPATGTAKRFGKLPANIDGPAFMAEALDERGILVPWLRVQKMANETKVDAVASGKTTFRMESLDLNPTSQVSLSRVVKEAVRTGDTTELRRLVQAGVDINADPKHADAPIICAIPGAPLVDLPKQTTAALKILLDGGAELYPKRSSSNPFHGADFDPVFKAVWHRRADALQELISRGIDLKRAQYALLFAARGGHLECVKALVEAGVDPIHPESDHREVRTRGFALLAARKAGERETAAYLERYMQERGIRPLAASGVRTRTVQDRNQDHLLFKGPGPSKKDLANIRASLGRAGSRRSKPVESAQNGKSARDQLPKSVEARGSSEARLPSPGKATTPRRAKRSKSTSARGKGRR